MTMLRMDHVVIPVSDLDAALRFYRDVVGLELMEVNGERTLATLRAGDQLVKLETPDRQGLVAARAVPGSADLCFESSDDPQSTVARCRACGVDVIDGPVRKRGARGAMTSVYVRDPDGSLVEIAHY
ncbi:VOC family protein [Bifidobacterium cuniculi]|uniref:Glyoxalase/bleomycin resistance protein/dioxygenase n=1 Tax=Bifidobacterium cuniculi TaxID=1688 RepID=A0A087AYB7_9BIFI|nr:VOC family protein [Bifidobacterium cuniculi]KFI63767.1 glyoxalase/bleomycin resistance protein/dioxygenase [Bifidobacterium cuniculi]